jgi:glycosyltransferase involved in cell wall biosynthesis
VNILYVNHYAGSPAHGMEYRPYYLAREWVRAGHAVRIAAASFSHVRSRQPAEPTPSRGRWRERVDGIDYDWYRVPSYSGNGVGRVRNIATFLWRLWRDAAAIARDFRPALVIASSTYPMDIWVARRIARMSGATLVFEVHDLWPLSPVEIGGMSPGHPFIRLCAAAERTAYRCADLVVSMLPNVAEHVAGHGLPPQRLAIVQNGMSLGEWDASPAAELREDVRQALVAARDAGCAVVGYAGSHGVPNALDTLLDAAASLRGEKLRFVMVGDGHERERLARRVRDEGLDNVAMFAPIAKSQVRAFLSRVDMAYLGAPRLPIYRFGVSPNKLIDYMMGGVPVLYAIEAGNDPVAEAGCGISVPAENAPALAEAIRRLAAQTPAARQAMGQRGRQHALQFHTYEALADRFLQAVRSTTKRA